jgi:hypothetical protein
LEGTFLSWIELEFDMNSRAAYGSINVAERYGDGLANLASLIGPLLIAVLLAVRLLVWWFRTQAT